MSANEYDYDVCLSFAGEQRAYAECVAELLKANELRVFYDKFEQATLWGKDLYKYLDDVYQHRAMYCVLFISSDYARKNWTTHERMSAQARTFASGEYILPVRFDETIIPGIRDTTAYIDARSTTPHQLVEYLRQKIEHRQTSAINRDNTYRSERTAWTPNKRAKLYQVDKSGPPALDWDTYSSCVRRAWDAVLNNPETGEKELHSFLEMHPCLIPGHDAFAGADGSAGDHPPGPIIDAAISHPPLPGIKRRVPDFLWLPTDSIRQWAVLVELEDPRKPWFTKTGQQTHQLSQTLNQIVEWQSHLDDPENQLLFRKMYEINRPLYFTFCLVHGRRSEPNLQSRESAKMRHNLELPDLRWMTYDRLRPTEAARDDLCVRVRQGKFVAVSAPATLQLSPYHARRLSDIAGKADAVLASPYFSPERREFLASRMQYWDERVRLGELCRNPADWFDTE